MKRLFSAREKAVLFLAADGRCENCGEELQDGWHADHIHPHSKNGATELVNGQALCAPCNLKKGKSIMTELREWQKSALDSALETFNDGSENYLAVACPGAGKTTWAVTVANEMKERGDINFIVVVVPSDALRTQWSDRADINLFPYQNPVDAQKAMRKGYDGIVTTYQALANRNGIAASIIDRQMSMSSGLVILDEIHHAATDNAYGAALQEAFGRAHRRLLLTGTPWRTNRQEQMPFVTFSDKDGMLEVDYNYSYGRAVKDKVCRPIQFPSVTATVEWSREGTARTEEVNVNRMLKGTDASDVVKSLLDASPAGGWLRSVIERAHKDLLSIRTEIPDAGGLIVARDKAHANMIAERLREVTGVRAPVVVSPEEDDAASGPKETIEEFRKGEEPWIIAVKMIAEGVDIPRLAVGVFATNVTTNMFFNQVVGRFVRTRPGENLTSRLYVVPTATMWNLVMEIEQSMPQQLDPEAEPRAYKEPTQGVLPGERPESSFVSIGSEAGELDRVAVGGQTISGASVEQWELTLEGLNVPPHYAANFAGAGLDPSAVAVATVEKPTEPLHRQEKRLRDEIHALAGKVAFHVYGDREYKKQVNGHMWSLFNTGVSSLNLTQLTRYKEVLQEWLRTGKSPLAS